MLRNLSAVVRQLNFNAERSLAEVNADYATTTELADILQRDADVPFRIGHHFASELVTCGRSNGLTPAEIPYPAAEEIYTRAAADYGLEGARLPLSEPAFHRSLSPVNMVRSSLGLGGPQPSEVARMLARQRAVLGEHQRWREGRVAALDGATRELDRAFEALRR